MRLEELKRGEIMALDLSRWSRYAGDEAASVKRLPKVTGSVAVVPVYGGLEPWKTQRISSAFTRAIESSSIGAVVLDIDSPGGTVHGTQELADTIYNARGSKPIVSVYNPLGASAAFWVGSAADKSYMVPSGDVGSVGVWAMHIDQSNLLDQIGVNVTLITAGKYKVEGHPFAPLDDEARAEFQRHVDYSYNEFTKGLSRNYGVSQAKIKSEFGEGRVLQAKQAKAAGMVDGISTLANVVAGLKRSSKNDARDTAMLVGGGVELLKRKRERRNRP